MSNKLFVGGLSYETTENTLKEVFSKFGKVESVRVIMDRDMGRSKGFGFVEMSSDEEAQAAIAGLDGTELDGRRMKVNEAMPQDPNKKFGGNGGGGYNNRRF